MAQKPETKFRKKVRQDLDALPNTAIFSIQQMAICGDPDFLLCINGLFFALELKKDEFEEPRPLQVYKLEKVSEAKGTSLVGHPENWNEIYQYLKETACAELELPQTKLTLN